MTEPVIESASMTAFPPDRSKMTITRVHPSEATRPPAPPRRAGDAGGRSAAEARCYTVWKRSSMGFQGTDGFCVYDGAGRLAFRVDNYARRRKLFAGELLLMDGRGAPLLAFRPQILSIHDRWNCYRTSEEAQGKVTRSSQQLFSMRKCSVLQRGHEAEVFMSSSAPDLHAGRRVPSFWVEGCFRRRSCKIRNGAGEEVARVTRKKAEAAASSLTLGDDVFSLVVQPGVDCEMVMAFLVVLDRICWRPYTPMMCAS